MVIICGLKDRSFRSHSNLATSIDLPWIVLGDFNYTRWHHEKSGGAQPRLCSMSEFNDCIDSCGLDDLHISGSHFTWSNSSFGSSRIQCRLDRVLINQIAILAPSQVHGSILNNGISDHHPILLENCNSGISCKPLLQPSKSPSNTSTPGRRRMVFLALSDRRGA